MTPERLKDALADVDIVEARNLLVGGAIVGAAIVTLFGILDAVAPVPDACVSAIQPPPEAIRPAAEDRWFLPPMSLSMNEDEEPPQTAEAAIEAAVHDPVARSSGRRRHYYHYRRRHW